MVVADVDQPPPQDRNPSQLLQADKIEGTIPKSVAPASAALSASATAAVARPVQSSPEKAMLSAGETLVITSSTADVSKHEWAELSQSHQGKGVTSATSVADESTGDFRESEASSTAGRRKSNMEASEWAKPR